MVQKNGRGKGLIRDGSKKRDVEQAEPMVSFSACIVLFVPYSKRNRIVLKSGILFCFFVYILRD